MQQTYGCKLKSSLTARVGLRLMDFEERRNQTVEYEFKVDKINSSEDSCYNTMIGNNLLYRIWELIFGSETKQLNRTSKIYH